MKQTFDSFMATGKESVEVETKQLILDTAESLFAREGYKATSLRDITRRAGVNLAAVNYHFGSKKELLEAIFERRLKPLNDHRIRKLTEIRKAAREQGKKLSVREILTAFIGPALRAKVSRKGEIDFLNLIGRAFIDLDVTVQEIFMRLMKPLSGLMIETLNEALPELPREVIFWRLQFVTGALARTMFVYKNPDLDKLRIVPDINPDSLLKSLVSFVTIGMEEPFGIKSDELVRSPDEKKLQKRVK